jgi:haloalkane dehalogenase
MAIIRTPEDRFLRLEDWPYQPRFTEIRVGILGVIRLAHYEAGPAEGPPVLLLHGEPTWAYLYRKMIPPLAAAGARVIAPDLFGFGQSDKPAHASQVSYATMLRTLVDWFDAQDLEGVTLFCQDWGGLLGLRLATARAERFARIVAANTFLPTGESPPTEAFLRWRGYSQKVEQFDCGAIVRGATARGISAAAQDAYNRPFPDERYKMAPRRMPILVPTTASDPEAPGNQAAWDILKRWEKPFLTLFSDLDPVTAPYARHFQERIPGAEGQPHATIQRAGHFLQEDAGEELAERVIAFMGLA